MSCRPAFTDHAVSQYGGSRSPQYGGLAGSEYYLRAIDDLDRLPRCNMQVLAGAEDPVQHAAYGA